MAANASKGGHETFDMLFKLHISTPVPSLCFYQTVSPQNPNVLGLIGNNKFMGNQ